MPRSGWKPTAIRRRYKLGPKWLHVFVNTSRDHMFDLPRFTSWGWSVFGRYSRNVTRNTERIDTPGPGGIWRRRG
jgi:hypothetical protein